MMRKMLMVASAMLIITGMVFAQSNSVTFVGRDAGDAKMSTYFAKVKVLFEAANPGKTVTLNQVQSTEQEYSNKSVLMMRSDAASDVFVIDSFMLPSFVAAGYVADIPVSTWSDWQSAFPAGIKKGVTFGGKTYAVPVSTDTRGLFYNIEAFKKAGIPTPWNPKTWADVLDAARKLKGKTEYPLWINCSQAQGEGATMQTFEMLLSGTPDWLMENGKWVASSKGFRDSLGFIEQAFIKDKLIDKKALSVMMDANSWQLANKIMGEGKIGIQIDGNWKGGDWVKYPDYKNKVAISPMPKQNGGGFTSMSGGWTIGVSALSKNKDLAFELVKAAVSKDGGMAWVVANGDMATRSDVGSDPAYSSENYYRTEMTKFAEFTNFRPGNENYPKVSQAIQVALESVITGAATPAAATATYAKAVKKIAGDGNWVEKK